MMLRAAAAGASAFYIVFPCIPSFGWFGLFCLSCPYPSSSSAQLYLQICCEWLVLRRTSNAANSWEVANLALFEPAPLPVGHVARRDTTLPKYDVREKQIDRL